MRTPPPHYGSEQLIFQVNSISKISMNRSILLAFLTSISMAIGGTLQIIDYEGQCLVYSTENFNCTGYSEPFAPLEGASCSSKQSTVDEEHF